MREGDVDGDPGDRVHGGRPGGRLHPRPTHLPDHERELLVGTG